MMRYDDLEGPGYDVPATISVGSVTITSPGTAVVWYRIDGDGTDRRAVVKRNAHRKGLSSVEGLAAIAAMTLADQARIHKALRVAACKAFDA